ncbi:MAG: nicotinate-nucleotide adenylyltransferase, partial [Shimia sp.]
MTQDRPFARAGQVVGLLGGSFDPPHAGHVHIGREALKRFGLDRLWWLVSPGNPLKAHGPAPLAARVAAGRALNPDPRVTVTGIEARLGTRYTAQTLAALQAEYHGVRFVWVMGADNLAQFHRWQDWREIAARVPIGVIARPGDRTRARTARAARILREARLPGHAAGLLGRAPAPAWCLVNVPMTPESSSAIRARTSGGKTA